MRLYDWPDRFNRLIEIWRNRPFVWGQSDCIRFADAVYQAQMGRHIFTDWFGTYTTEWGCLLNYKKQLKKTGFANIESAIDSRLRRVDGLQPPRGAIIGRNDETTQIVTGTALGVGLGAKAAFLGYDGLEFTDIKPTDIFWCVE
mgnify:CR=1 FL=1